MEKQKHLIYVFSFFRLQVCFGFDKRFVSFARKYMMPLWSFSGLCHEVINYVLFYFYCVLFLWHVSKNFTSTFFGKHKIFEITKKKLFEVMQNLCS